MDAEQKISRLALEMAEHAAERLLVYAEVEDGVISADLWSRNPMYVGRLLQLLALSLYLASPVGLICVPVFAIYLDRVQVRAEERALAERFPLEFAKYCSRVRRWV